MVRNVPYRQHFLPKISVTLSKSNPSIGHESIPNNAAEVIMLANAM